MATATQSDTKKRKPARAKSGGSRRKSATARRATNKDAVDMLEADHRTVEKLFAQYEKAKENAERKQAVCQQICNELLVHAAIEEEIFYPASREFVDEEDIVNEAYVEHASAKDLITQLEGMDPSDEMYDAKVKVLQEMVEHHVEEEEGEYFPQVRKNGMELEAIGEQMMTRKLELMGQMDGMSRQ